MILTAVHQDGFRPEHLRHLGQDRRSSLGHDPVAETAQQRIGSYAGKAVGAAAFKAYLQLAHRDVRALVFRADIKDAACQFQPHRDFISFDLLGLDGLYPGSVHLPHQFHKRSQLVVFAAEGDNQHAAGVGMMDHVRQDVPCILVVIAKLRTTVVMRECNDGIHRAHASGFLFPQLLRNRLCDSVHASDRGNDPELVSDTGLSIPPSEALESPWGAWADFRERRLVAILEQAFQIRFQAVVIDARANGDITRHMAYRISVLDHVIPFRKVFKGYFVPCRHIFFQDDAAVGQLDDSTRSQRLQGDCDIVRWINPDVLGHLLPL